MYLYKLQGRAPPFVVLLLYSLVLPHSHSSPVSLRTESPAGWTANCSHQPPLVPPTSNSPTGEDAAIQPDTEELFSTALPRVQTSDVNLEDHESRITHLERSFIQSVGWEEHGPRRPTSAADAEQFLQSLEDSLNMSGQKSDTSATSSETGLQSSVSTNVIGGARGPVLVGSHVHSYSVLEKLGEGEYAVTYKVKHGSTGNIYAMKVPKINGTRQVCQAVHAALQLPSQNNLPPCNLPNTTMQTQSGTTFL
jgi:hypothetical protein